MLGLGRYWLKAATARLAEGSHSSTAEVKKKETLTYDSELDLRQPPADCPSYLVRVVLWDIGWTSAINDTHLGMEQRSPLFPNKACRTKERF